jgi:hypothetical protein
MQQTDLHIVIRLLCTSLEPAHNLDGLRPHIQSISQTLLAMTFPVMDKNAPLGPY